MFHVRTMYWGVSLEAVWISNNKHFECKNIQTWYSLNFLNPPVQELLGPSPSMILITLFGIKNTLCKVVDEPQKIIPLFISDWKCAQYWILNVSLFSM